MTIYSYTHANQCSLLGRNEQICQKCYIPREQVAANPIPFTSSGATFAEEQADFTAAQIASHMSVEDCCFKKNRTSHPLFLLRNQTGNLKIIQHLSWQIG